MTEKSISEIFFGVLIFKYFFLSGKLTIVTSSLPTHFKFKLMNFQFHVKSKDSMLQPLISKKQYAVENLTDPVSFR